MPIGAAAARCHCLPAIPLFGERKEIHADRFRKLDPDHQRHSTGQEDDHVKGVLQIHRALTILEQMHN